MDTESQKPLVVTNEKVISFVEENIVENHTNLSKHDLAEFLYGWYLLRTKQHVKYVNIAGSYLKPAFDACGFGNRFEEFQNNLKLHDNDKFENSALYIALSILGTTKYNKELAKRYKASQYALITYEQKVWPEHARTNFHHPESWGGTPRNRTGRPKLCDDFHLFYSHREDWDNVTKEDLTPDELYHGFEKIAETVSDWAGMGIELHDSATAWYQQTKGVKWEFSGIAEDYLVKLLEASEEITKYEFENELTSVKYPEYVEPEELPASVEVQNVETCGCYVSEVSMEALEEAKEKEIFSPAVKAALKKFQKYDYACLYKDGALIRDQEEMNQRDGRDIIIQTPEQVDEHKAGMCHDMTCYFDYLLNKEKTEHLTVYIASKEPPSYTTHSFVVVRNNLNTWSVIDVFAVGPGFYKAQFSTPEQAAIARIKLWIKLDNHGSNNAEAFMNRSCPKPGVNLAKWSEQAIFGHFGKWKTSKEPAISKEDLEISTEDMILLSKTADQKKLNALAKPLYNTVGQNSWEHIRQDVGNAVFLVKQKYNRELTNKEYATILFHDCSVKLHPDKVKHSLVSSQIAKPILLNCGLFTKEEVDEICQAIIEHDADMNPEMKFSTDLSDLLASADFNPPNPAWILNKSWSWGIKHGLDYEGRMNNTMTKIPGFYGSKGGAVYPKLYTEIHGSEIREMQKFFDQLTREECEKIIQDYRKKHKLGESETKLPDPSIEGINTKIENNIENDTVYHCSPLKLDILSGKKSRTSNAEGAVFVSPFKHFASMFILDFQGIVNVIEEQIGKKHIKIDNFGFMEWNQTPKSTLTVPSKIHVLVRTPEDFKPFKGKATGYMYTIDLNKYKDKIDMWSGAKDSDVEFVIRGDVKYEKCEEISYEYEVQKDTKQYSHASTEAIVTPTHTTVVISPTEVIDIPRGVSKETQSGTKIYCEPSTGNLIILSEERED